MCQQTFVHRWSQSSTLTPIQRQRSHSGDRTSDVRLFPFFFVLSYYADTRTADNFFAQTHTHAVNNCQTILFFLVPIRFFLSEPREFANTKMMNGTIFHLTFGSFHRSKYGSSIYRNSILIGAWASTTNLEAFYESLGHFDPAKDGLICPILIPNTYTSLGYFFVAANESIFTVNASFQLIIIDIIFFFFRVCWKIVYERH